MAKITVRTTQSFKFLAYSVEAVENCFLERALKRIDETPMDDYETLIEQANIQNLVSDLKGKSKVKLPTFR